MARPKLCVEYRCRIDFNCDVCERTKEMKIAALLDALKELTGDDYTPAPRVIENTNYVSNK